MKLDAIPTIRVGDVSFGMDRDKVRSILGHAVEFYKFDDDENTTDDFEFCHVYYDKMSTAADRACTSRHCAKHLMEPTGDMIKITNVRRLKFLTMPRYM